MMPSTGERSAKAASDLNHLLTARDQAFFSVLAERTRATTTFVEGIGLSTLRRKALKVGMAPHVPSRGGPVRVAVIGGCNFYPLIELIEHCLFVSGIDCQMFSGEYDNYAAEILEPGGKLAAFRPDVTVLIPHRRLSRYPGSFLDRIEVQAARAKETAADILELCRRLTETTGSEIILTNFPPPSRHDPGSYRSRCAGSSWTYGKLINLELGFHAPPQVQICDVEFLASRLGTLNALDDRAWFESKQPYAPDMSLQVAKEAVHMIASAKRPMKKVLVMDLDNTLWGGVVGDDGLEGIELGDTSPRGEAFKEFQRFVLSLTERGVLLAVCSKNDHENAIEPFDKHPEMVLRAKDLVSFKANWRPKSENICDIARELNLGLDSFVFVDDNPAEIEIVRQFVPEVESVLLGPDPSCFTAILQDSRLFEPRSITVEDSQRVVQYKIEAERAGLMAGATDMRSYLASLDMKAEIREFVPVDVARIAQLVNKSNQFNLTTIRRTESEVQAIVKDRTSPAFTVRLADRFGEYGLISVIITRIVGTTLEIDTWLMSCRVLKRQVEDEVVNEIVRLATLNRCSLVCGRYIPTPKNSMVEDLLPSMGFTLSGTAGGGNEFVLDPASYQPRSTEIQILRRSYDSV